MKVALVPQDADLCYVATVVKNGVQNELAVLHPIVLMKMMAVVVVSPRSRKLQRTL